MDKINPETLRLLTWIVIGIFIFIGSVFLKARVLFFSFISEWSSSEFGKKAMYAVIGEYLSSPSSELNSHKNDPDAHEKMRKEMNREINARFDKLEQMIVSAHTDQTRELNRFREDSFNRVINLIDKVTDKLT